MKIGNIEGTREEIKGFIEDHGLKAADLLQMPNIEKRIRNVWVVLAFTVFILFSILLHFIGNSNALYIPSVILSIAIGVWGTILIQLKYKNWGATSICIFTMLGI